MDDGSFRQEPGAGAVGAVRGRTVKVGTLAFVTGGESAGVTIPPEVASIASNSNPGRTPVFVAIDGIVAGVLERIEIWSPSRYEAGHTETVMGLENIKRSLNQGTPGS